MKSSLLSSVSSFFKVKPTEGEEDFGGYDTRASESVNVALLPIIDHVRKAPQRFRSPAFAPLPLVSEILQFSPEAQEAEVATLRQVAAQLDADANAVVDIYWQGFNKSIKSYSAILGHVTEAKQLVYDLVALLADVQKLQDEKDSAPEAAPSASAAAPSAQAQPRKASVSKLEYLWSKYLEYCAVVELYDKIRLLRDSIPAVREFERAGYFLHAASVLKKALDTLTEVAEYEILGIRDLCATILDSKQRLADKIVLKLSEHVYLKREDELEAAAAATTASTPTPVDAPEATTTRVSFKLATDPAGGIDTAETAEEDLSKPPEADSKVFIRNCVHALNLLSMVKGATAEFQKMIRNEVRRLFKPSKVALALAAKEVYSLEGAPPSELPPDVREKAPSLEEMFDKCAKVIRNHALVAEAISKYEQSFFTVAYVWERMQMDILEVLKQFLQTPDTARAKAASLIEQNKLFSFAAASMAAEDGRQKASAKGSQERKGGLVDVGNPRNVIALHPLLTVFDERVDNLLGRPVSPPLRPILRAYMESFVTEQYLPFLHYMLKVRTDDTLGAPEILKTVNRKDKDAPAHQLLSSVVTIHSITRMIYEDAVSLPQFCDQLLVLLEEAMIRFLGHCEELYSASAARGLLDGAAASVKVLHGRDGKEVYAFLKADQLWTPVGGGSEDPSGGRTAAQSSSFESPASPLAARRSRSRLRDDEDSRSSGSVSAGNPNAEVDEVKQFLPQAFNDMSFTIGRNQLVHDVQKLVLLADLHTSLDWFVRKLRKLNGTVDEISADRSAALKKQHLKKLKRSDVAQLRKVAISAAAAAAAAAVTPATATTPAADAALGKLRQKIDTMAARFAAISEDSLFTLRLELKLQCVHYLSACRKTLYFCDDSESTPDTSVLELNRRLVVLEEVLAAHLQPHRLRYVFDGVAATICSAMIGNVMAIQRINRPGIRKLLRNVFAIQQNLTLVVSKKEPYFDRVRQYVELLYLADADELYSHIAQKISERKPLFTLDQYRVILELQSPGKKLSALVLQTFQKLLIGIDS